MALLDQYNSQARPLPFAGLLRSLSRVSLSQVLSAPKFLFRRTDAELLQKRLRVAERVSAKAAKPTSIAIVEPKRLTSEMIIARLQPEALVMESMADDIALTTDDALQSLDRIEYDLATIRDEIAPFMPVAPQRPCESKSHYRM